MPSSALRYVAQDAEVPAFRGDEVANGVKVTFSSSTEADAQLYWIVQPGEVSHFLLLAARIRLGRWKCPFSIHSGILVPVTFEAAVVEDIL